MRRPVQLGWQSARLGECCEIVSGATPRTEQPEYWNGGIPWATPRDLSTLDSPVLRETAKRITRAGYESCSTSLLPAGSVLFTSRAPVGLVAIAGQPMCTNQGFKSLIPGPDLDPTYLFWCVRAFAGAIERRGSGTTFTEISKEVMSRFEIPLPPLPEQRRVAAVLDKADAMQRNQRERIRLLDQFLRSAFLEMFGDPVRNEKGWELLRLADCLLEKPVIGTITPATEPGEFSVIRVGELGEYDVAIDRAGRVSVPGKDLSRFEAREGDLLLARAIGSEQYLGKASVMQRVPQRILFDSHVMRLRPNPECTRGSFLWHLFQTSGGRRLLLKHGGRTAVQFNINTSQVADVRIPLPPFEHQERFLSLAARARILQFKHITAGVTTDMLFDSVAHLAFRGELSGA